MVEAQGTALRIVLALMIDVSLIETTHVTQKLHVTRLATHPGGEWARHDERCESRVGQVGVRRSASGDNGSPSINAAAGQSPPGGKHNGDGPLVVHTVD